MRFGSIFYPHFPRSIAPVVVGASVIQHARTAVDAGFDMVWMGHHYLTEYQTLQPIPVLARLAAEVPGTWLGASFILPLYNPIDFAEQTATLDVLTGGKLICNAVMGYRDDEFAALGISKTRRASRLTEGLELVRRLWMEEHVTFNGKNFNVQDVTISTRPAQKPRPPLWMGGNSIPAIERIARIGDAWAIGPYQTLETLKGQIAVYENALVTAGKDPVAVPRVLFRDVYIAETNQLAREQAEPFLKKFYAQYASWGKEEAIGQPGELTQGFSDLLKDRFIIGDPDTFVREITRYKQELKIDWLMLQINRPDMPLEWVLKGVDLLGKHVLPHFQDDKST